MFGLTLFLPEVTKKLFLFKKSVNHYIVKPTGSENKENNTNPGRFLSSKIVYRVLRGTCNSEFRFKKLAL